MQLHNLKKILFSMLTICIVLAGCEKEVVWEPGSPFPKEKIKIGVVHITDPFTENTGYAYSHQQGIERMKQALGLSDSQIIYRINVDNLTPLNVERAIRGLIMEGANIILATSWGYMEDCQKLAAEYPNVVFAHASGHMRNDTNFTNYYGRAYQAKYLAGIVAGKATVSNKIGFVSPWGTDNSEVTANLNAFAMGVEKVNPVARVYVYITHNWFDPIGETLAAHALIDEGCDIISQDVDSPTPQIVAAREGVWGIGYNTDMSADAPGAVLTSVIWDWGVYYTMLVQSVIDGTFDTTPWYGSIKDGIVDLAPLSEIAMRDPETLLILEKERQRIESGEFDVFSGTMETNDGRTVGQPGETIKVINVGIDWYYRNIEVLR